MSAEQFAAAWTKTGRAEGGYVNDPNDAGRATCHGITEAVARAHGFTGDMKDLTVGQATTIAKQAYWDPLKLDDLGALSAPVAAKLFDMGFLMGIGMAGLMFQRALNLFGRADLATPIYPPLTEDGNVGAMSVHAFTQYMDDRGADGETVMLACLAAQEGYHFMELCRAKPQDDKFVFGWFLNRDG